MSSLADESPADSAGDTTRAACKTNNNNNTKMLLTIRCPSAGPRGCTASGRRLFVDNNGNNDDNNKDNNNNDMTLCVTNSSDMRE